MRFSSLLLPLVLLAGVSLGCEPDRAAVTSVAPTPVVLTSSHKLSLASAAHWVARAHEQAFEVAILNARSALVREEDERAPTIPDTLATQGERLTFVFSANNHGEREDCGCKRNPLGGLTRRATLLDLVGQTSSDKQAAVYWESRIERAGALFIVDAGDALFKSTTLKSSPQITQAEAMTHAQGVIDALNVRPPDVVNVGEYDLSLGVDVLQTLTARAKFPFISANLRRQGDPALMFPGHLIVERDGKRVAYIGLTKQRARVNDYYKEQGVEVDEAKAAYIREVKALPPDVDVVVMLNNEGVPATQVLIEELRAERVRVDIAFVSNSNMLTRTPKWTAGVPVLEPMSQGKQLGRFDLWLTGDEPPAFMNDIASRLAPFDAYRRAWQGYLQARYKLAQHREHLAHQRVVIEEGVLPTSSKKDDVPPNAARLDEARARARVDLERAEKQLASIELRVALTLEEALMLAKKVEEPTTERASGDDWAEAHVVPVLLEIPEEPATRKVLDRYKER